MLHNPKDLMRFWWKWPFWPPWPWMTFDPIKGHMTYAGWVIDHCDQVSLKSIKTAGRYIRLYGWQKKEERRRKKNHRKTVYRRMWMRLYKNHRKTEYRRMWMRLYKKHDKYKTLPMFGRVTTRDICVCKQTLVHRRIFYDERDCFCRCWDEAQLANLRAVVF